MTRKQQNKIQIAAVVLFFREILLKTQQKHKLMVNLRRQI